MANTNKLDRVLDPEVAQEFIDQGYNTPQLANEFWVSVPTVTEYLKMHGLKIKKWRNGTQPLKEVLTLEDAERRLNAGETYSSLAKELGFSKITVQNYCNNNGLYQVYRERKDGVKLKVRENARADANKVERREVLVNQIVALLEQAYSWDEIASEVGHAKGYCSNLASKNEVYSMYVRIRGKLYQVRNHPRDPHAFPERIPLGDIEEAKNRINSQKEAV